jgi:hypothetical protein
LQAGAAIEGDVRGGEGDEHGCRGGVVHTVGDPVRPFGYQDRLLGQGTIGELGHPDDPRTDQALVRIGTGFQHDPRCFHPRCEGDRRTQVVEPAAEVDIGQVQRRGSDTHP